MWRRSELTPGDCDVAADAEYLKGLLRDGTGVETPLTENLLTDYVLVGRGRRRFGGPPPVLVALSSAAGGTGGAA